MPRRPLQPATLPATLRHVAFVLGLASLCVEALQVSRETPEQRPWWDWSDIKAKLNLTGGLDAVSFTKNSGAPVDLFWWQFMDGKYMTNRTTCRSFDFDQDWEAVQSKGTIPPTRFEDCSEYIKGTYNSYIFATQHLGKPWRVEDLIAVNKRLRGKINMTKQMKLYDIAEETWTPVVARDSQMTKDEKFRDKAGLAPLKQRCEKLFPWSWFVRGKDLACVDAHKKRAFLQQYLDEYYAGLARVPPPPKRGPADWETYLDLVSGLLVKLYELHPFLDGNSRTRLIFLDVLLTEGGLHPLLGLYDIKSPVDMRASIREGLKLWETTVLTGRNAWLEHAHARP